MKRLYPLGVVLLLGLMGFEIEHRRGYPRAAVAANHPLASQAGAELLRSGGNAVDAAVAAALASGVVQPSASGFGGGGFAVVVNPKHPTGRAIDFREVAPLKTTRSLYLQPDGQPIPKATLRGGTAVGVPLESRGLAKLLREEGSKSFWEVVSPAITLAREGYEVGAHFASALARTPEGNLHGWFQGVHGQPLTEGDRWRNLVLAQTLRRFAATKGEDLATGPGAKLLVEEVQAQGGVLSLDDLARAVPVERDVLKISYRGYTVLSMSPPSSGGVALSQMLRVLENEELSMLAKDEVAYLHRLAETMKHAYADRAQFLGDPSFYDVPLKRLLSEERAKEIRQKFDPQRTLASTEYGLMVDSPKNAGTLHISALDRQGMAVALTTTINTAFGNAYVPEKLGFPLNSEMDDFSLLPGIPNAFGLMGSEANAMRPLKKPLSSMTPTVILSPEGEVVLVLGASGGSQIISSVLQVLLNVVDRGMSPQEAVSSPRIHHQWLPDVLILEPGFSESTTRGLLEKGHKVKTSALFSAVQVIHASDLVRAASDPRKGGEAVVVEFLE